MKSSMLQSGTARCRSTRLAHVVLLTAVLVAAPFTQHSHRSHPHWVRRRASRSGWLDGDQYRPDRSSPETWVSDPGTSVTGFPPGTVTDGTILGPGAMAALGPDSRPPLRISTWPARLALSVIPLVFRPISAGMTLVPGVYCFASSAGLTGTLTLDALGNPQCGLGVPDREHPHDGSRLEGADDQWRSTMQRVLAGRQLRDAQDEHRRSSEIFSRSRASPSRPAPALAGRALARNGAVTMDDNTVAHSPRAAVAAGHSLPPTLAKAFSPAHQCGRDSTLTITLSNPDAHRRHFASLADTLPSGVLVAGGASTTCGGTVTDRRLDR